MRDANLACVYASSRWLLITFSFSDHDRHHGLFRGYHYLIIELDLASQGSRCASLSTTRRYSRSASIALSLSGSAIGGTADTLRFQRTEETFKNLAFDLTLGDSGGVAQQLTLPLAYHVREDLESERRSLTWPGRP